MMEVKEMKILRKYKGEQLAEGEKLVIQWDDMTERNQILANMAYANDDIARGDKICRPHTYVYILVETGIK